MPFPNEHSARIRDPGDFIPNSFRSKDLKDGVRMILGKLKGQDTMTVQTYRFSVDKFTAEQAKQWLKDHDITNYTFEKAKNIKMSMTDTDKVLFHWGVLGMKWGKRRESSSEHIETRAIKKKKVREMSNAELKKLTTRLQLEKQLKDLNPTKVARGKKAVFETLGDIGKVGGGLAALGTMIALGKKLYTQYGRYAKIMLDEFK